MFMGIRGFIIIIVVVVLSEALVGFSILMSVSLCNQILNSLWVLDIFMSGVSLDVWLFEVKQNYVQFLLLVLFALEMPKMQIAMHVCVFMCVMGLF